MANVWVVMKVDVEGTYVQCVCSSEERAREEFYKLKEKIAQGWDHAKKDYKSLASYAKEFIAELEQQEFPGSAISENYCPVVEQFEVLE